jgi:DNA-binding LacI/PurR family transcriptional regulator
MKMNFDGLIYSPTNADSREMRILLEDNFPMVFLDRVPAINEICCVVPDNFEGTYQAVKYLLGLGHRRIVIITGPKELSTQSTRLEGYKHALAEEGVDFDRDLCIQGDFQFKSSYYSIQNLLERTIPFTAIIAANDLTAFGSKKALEDKGLKIPNDVSMIGLDNDDVLFSSSMGLTSIIQPTYEMGKNAMMLLNGLMEGRIKPPRRVILRPSIAIKDSCRVLDR